MRTPSLDRSAKKADIKLSHMVALFLIFSSIIILFIAYDTFFLRTPPSDVLVTALDDGWTIARNSIPVSSTKLSEYNTGKTKDGTVFTLTRKLDEEMCLAPCLMIRLPQAILSVEVDGEEVFRYNKQAANGNKMAARTHAFAPLSEMYAGKELTVILTATDGGAFYGLGPIYYGSQPELMQFFLRQRREPFIFGLFLIMFGVAQMIYVPVLMNNDKPDMTLVIGALATFDCGLYLLSYYGIFDLFLKNVTTNTVIEYLSLYSIPCLMCSYFLTELEGTLKTVYTGFVIFDVLFIITIFFLHIFGLVFVTSFLKPLNLLILIEGLPFVVISFNRRGRRKNNHFDHLHEISDLIIIFALALYTTCYLIDGVLFWVSRVFFGREHPYGIPFVMFGSVVFSALLATHYFLHSVCNMRVKVQNDSLEEKAFSDQLTGLANRAKCQQVLESIGIEKIPYFIISMDLDKLKTVNDTMGHAEGDRLLSTFAKALKESFKEARLVGRMGGDEFIVILDGEMCRESAYRIKDLQNRLDSLNKSGDVLEYSVSVGCAANTDTELGARAFDIYMLADRRMYDMKQKRHAEMAMANQ